MRTSRPAHGSRSAARGPLPPWRARARSACSQVRRWRHRPTSRPRSGRTRSTATRPPRPTSPSTRSGTTSTRPAPIYVAILPTSARDLYGGSVTELGKAIANELRRNGSYMVVSGDQWAAANYGGAISNDQAKTLASQAVDDHRNDPQAAVLQWVDQVGAAARGEPVGQTGGDGGGGAGGVIGAAAVLTALAVGGGADSMRAAAPRTAGRAPAGAGGGQGGRPGGPWPSPTTSAPSTWTPACPTPTVRRYATTPRRSTSTRRRRPPRPGQADRGPGPRWRPRGRPVRDGVDQGDPGGPPAPRAPAPLLLRPPPRPLGRGRPVGASRRRPPDGPGVRGRRPADP